MPSTILQRAPDNLKPCPWCGSAPILIQTYLGQSNGRGYTGCHSYAIYCSNAACKAMAPNGRYDDIYQSSEEAIKKAIEAWNKRSEKNDVL